MQSLWVPTLTLRQLGRLHSPQLLGAIHGPHPSAWSPRTLYTRQLWGSVAPTVQRAQAQPKVLHPSACWSLQQTRLKSSKRKGQRAAKQQEQDEDEDEEDPEASDYEDELKDDPGLPKDYKDQQRHVQSFRFDLVIKEGLDMARAKVDDAFYGNMLRCNGKKILKKSKMVEVGDTLDLILGEDEETDTVSLKRVIFKKIVGETNDATKYKVILRSWKSLRLPRQDFYKQ